MKLRWSNGYNFEFEFEANTPASFHEQALSALRSFRIAQHRRVHRGEIHKTVFWCGGCSLNVYDDANHQWYYPAGEPTSLDTKSFGSLSINRHFDVRVPFVEAASLDNLHADYKFDLIGLDSVYVEHLDLGNRDASDRIWNLCMGVYQHINELSAFVMSVGDVIDKHIDQTESNDE